MNEQKNVAVPWLLGLAGALVGGVVGYLLFAWLLRQGLYALVLPGALVGLGCGKLSGIRSVALGAICGVAALVLGFYIEWRFFPWKLDESLNDFVANAHKLRPMTWIMILLGAFIGYRWGTGSDRVRLSDPPAGEHT